MGRRRGAGRRNGAGPRPARAGAAGEHRPLRAPHWRADGSPKRRFPSEADANRAALFSRLEHGTDLDAYPCSFCGGWHLGSRPG